DAAGSPWVRTGSSPPGRTPHRRRGARNAPRFHPRASPCPRPTATPCGRSHRAGAPRARTPFRPNACGRVRGRSQWRIAVRTRPRSWRPENGQARARRSRARKQGSEQESLASKSIPHMSSRRFVGSQNRLARACRQRAQIVKRPRNRERDVAEPNAPLEKQRNRGFARRIEDRRRRAPRPPCLHTKLQRGEVFRSDALEGERRQFHRIEWWYPRVGNALRMSKRIQHRKLHARHPQLSENAPVHELHEGMYDALGVNDDVDLIEGQAEEVVCLDHLEGLVRKGSAVDRDLPSHAPRRVLERIREGRSGNVVRAPVAEGSAGSGEDHASHLYTGPAGEALQDGAVLTVHLY